MISRNRLSFISPFCVAIAMVGCGSSGVDQIDDAEAGQSTGGHESNGGSDVMESAAGMHAGGGAAVGGTGGAAGTGSKTGTGGAAGMGGKAGAGGTSGVGGVGIGGAAGAGGGGMAGNCGSLPASGAWENIVPAGVTQSDALVVDPFDSAIVWLGTKGAGLFKSTDCGATWAHVSTGRNGALMATGEMVSMAVDPTKRGVIYATSWTGAEGVWKSINGGVDWDKIFPTPALDNAVGGNNQMSSIGMEAGNSQHLIVSAHAPCNPPNGPICLAETSDGGATWRMVTVPPPSQSPSGNWTNYIPGAGAFILSASTWLFPSYSDGLWLTTDDGASFKNVVPQGAWGATGGKTLNHPFVPSPQGTYYLVSQQGMLKSKDGLSWSLIPNSGGSGVGFAMGNGHLYSANQWSVTYNTAADDRDTIWSPMTPPPAPIFETFPQGGVYLAYDEGHHILYSSNWHGGTWRIAAP